MIQQYDPENPPVLPRNHMQALGEKEGVVAPVFAEHAFRPSYAFRGIAPFIDAEAGARDYRDHSLRSRMHGDWFVTSASNALGNACCQPRREAARASLDRAIALRDIMAIALAATEAAIVETARQLELPEPPFARKPEVSTNGTRRLRRAEHPGE